MLINIRATRQLRRGVGASVQKVVTECALAVNGYFHPCSTPLAAVLIMTVKINTITPLAHTRREHLLERLCARGGRIAVGSLVLRVFALDEHAGAQQRLAM